MSTLTSAIRKNINSWWVFLVIGTLLIIGGFIMLLFPISTYVSLTLTFGLLIFIIGLIHLIFALSNRTSIVGWGWTLLVGILGLILGLILMAFPGISMAIIPYFIAFWILVRGIYLISYTTSTYMDLQYDRSWLIFGGIINILLAVLILLFPIIGVFTIVVWIGWTFIVGGIFEIVLAFQLKKMHSQLSES